MAETELFARNNLAVIDYRCEAGPETAPFEERHRRFSVSYVRKGSFGVKARGKQFDLIPGSLFVGHPDDEYVCTHDHHICGDECLSIQLEPELAETIGARADVWRRVSVPPLAEMMVVGELAQSVANGESDLGFDEAALVFASRFAGIVTDRTRQTIVAQVRERARAV